MRKLVWIIITISVVILGYRLFHHSESISTNSLEPSQAPNSNSQNLLNSSTTIFVPYWEVTGDQLDIQQYDRVVYFGVSANRQGINTTDTGYKNLPLFQATVTNSEKLLTVRMLDTDTNLEILKDKASWNGIINDSIETAQAYGFSGIVLDLELSSLPFDNVVSNITRFVGAMSSQVKKNNLTFAMATYGDTFYRQRSFDIEALAPLTDEMMIMAYDFHKSRGEPGPNFPLEKGSTYSYDFTTMVNDYLQYVSPERLTVIFGMYGYDWIVDEKKRPIKPARALSLNDIESDFVQSCSWKNCYVRRDDLSAETEINYVDSSAGPLAQNHIVWFEDEKSVAKKVEFLKRAGIGNIAYWVYGYF